MRPAGKQQSGLIGPDRLNDSEYRESAEASGALPRLDPRASWFLSLMFYTVAIGTIASKLLSGKYPWEYLEDDKKEGGGEPLTLWRSELSPLRQPMTLGGP